MYTVKAMSTYLNCNVGSNIILFYVYEYWLLLQSAAKKIDLSDF